LLTCYVGDEKVWAMYQTNRKLDYRDEFDNEMILVKCTKKVDYFRHYPGVIVPYESEPETEEHLKGKLFVHDFFNRFHPRTDIEVYSKEAKRRADVLVPELNMVVEVQCSPIREEDLKARTKDWNRTGYNVLWLFGKNYRNANIYLDEISTVERHIMAKTHQLHYLMLDYNCLLRVKLRIDKDKRKIRDLVFDQEKIDDFVIFVERTAVIEYKLKIDKMYALELKPRAISEGFSHTVSDGYVILRGGKEVSYTYYTITDSEISV